MLIIGIVLVLISTILGSIAGFQFKKGAVQLNRNRELIRNKKVILGAFLYVFAVMFYVIGLKFGDLTFLYPLNSLSYIWIALLSYFYLKEEMNNFKIGGIVLIIFGVLLIGIG